MKLKILFIFILISFLTESTFAASTLDVLLQPHLKVVEYNETLEWIKVWLLNSTSIYSDSDLFRKWSNVLVSLWILVLLIIILKVWLNIILWKKDNMIKFIAFSVLLFFVWSIYTPFFSWVSELMTWKQLTYKDPVSWREFSRVYLPANTWIKVMPYIIDEKDWKKYLDENQIMMPQRSDWSEYTWEYLWIPWKVVQTQWQSKTDTTDRYSKAFYWVDLDTLFKWSSDLDVDYRPILWIQDWCHIQPYIFWSQRQWKNTQMSFLEALWKKEWELKANTIFTGNNNKVKYPLEDNYLLRLKYYKNSPLITKWNTQSIKLSKDECTLWVYLLSDEFLTSLNERKSEEVEAPEVLINDDESIDSLRGLLFNPLYAFYYSDLFKVLEKSSYQDQKRILYTYNAIKTLFFLTQVTLSEDIKTGSDKLSNAIKSCGRVITSRVQSNIDYKDCLLVDQAWDTTLYTQDTTSSIGLLWKNPEINWGYVLPVPYSLDWEGNTLWNVYWDSKTFLDNPVENIWKVAAEATWINGFAKKTAEGIIATAKFIWSIWNWIWDNWWDSEVEDKLEKLWLTDFQGLTETEKVKVLYVLEQEQILNSTDNWYKWVMSPYLASFNAYDIDWDWKIDNDEYKDETTREKDINYYAYHYWTKAPTTRVSNIDFLKSSFFETIEVWNYNLAKYLFTRDQDWSNVIFEEWDSNYKASWGTSRQLYSINNENGYFIPDINNSKNNLSNLIIKWTSLFTGEDMTSSQFYIKTPINKDWKNFNFDYIDTLKPYYFFWILPKLKNLKGYVKKWNKEEYVNLSDEYNFSETGSFTIRTWENQTLDEIFIKKEAWLYYYYKGSLDLTKGVLLSERDWLSIFDYQIKRRQEKNTTVNPIYTLEENKYDSNWKKIWVISTPYIEENKQVTSIWKQKYGKYINQLALMKSDILVDWTTDIYSYINLKENKIKSFNLKLNKGVSEIYSTLDTNNLIDLLKNTELSVKTNWTIKRDTYNWSEWVKEKLELKEVNFDKIDTVFNSKDRFNGLNPRILLNPLLNPPLSYSPNNEHYLPEYQKTKNICLVNPDYTDRDKLIFDNYPSSDVDLSKCSNIWNHMRLTDVRLNTYTQDNWMFAGLSNKEIFTHINIPLVSSEYIDSFTSDRRDQNYAWEAVKGNNLFWSTQVEWIKVHEWDLVVLKPWVIIWAYDNPFTLLIPTELENYIKYVKLDNPSEEIIGSYVYTGWIYDWLTTFVGFMKNWSLSEFLLWGDVIDVANEEKYSNYTTEKFDSRPNSLKYIEGSVPDRFFHAYYWEWYFSSSDSGFFNSWWKTISELIYSLFNALLIYRVEILKWIFVLSPILTFTLLFEGTRKIFSFITALTIWLLILPVMVLLFVNLFN